MLCTFAYIADKHSFRPNAANVILLEPEPYVADVILFGAGMDRRNATRPSLVLSKC